MEIAIKRTRKEHIYAAAAQLFRDKGYTATSMRDLADAVGLEPSSLYSHIKSKEELLGKICFDCGRRFLRGLEMIAEKFKDPEAAIRALIQLHVKIASEDITSITVFNDEWRNLSEPDLSKFLTMRRNYEAACLGIILGGIESGVFRKTDPKIALRTLLSALQWIYRGKRIGVQQVDAIAHHISELFLNGLNK